MIRFLLHWFTIKVLSYSIHCGGITWKVLRGIDKEYEDDESWSKGKKEAIQTLIICIICLILISCIIH